MPYHDEEIISDWEPVTWKKTKPQSTPLSNPPTDSPPYQPSTFAQRLVSARHKSRLTMHQLAQCLHIKISLLQDLENGHTLPSKPLLAKINKKLESRLQLPTSIST